MEECGKGWNSIAIWAGEIGSVCFVWFKLEVLTMNNSCGILICPWFLFKRLQPVRHLSFPAKLQAPDAFFRPLDDFIWISRWKSREDHQKEEGGRILGILWLFSGASWNTISGVSGWKTSLSTHVSTTTALWSGILDSISHDAKALAMHWLLYLYAKSFKKNGCNYNLALNWIWVIDVFSFPTIFSSSQFSDFLLSFTVIAKYQHLHPTMAYAFCRFEC